MYGRYWRSQRQQRRAPTASSYKVATQIENPGWKAVADRRFIFEPLLGVFVPVSQPLYVAEVQPAWMKYPIERITFIDVDLLWLNKNPVTYSNARASAGEHSVERPVWQASSDTDKERCRCHCCCSCRRKSTYV